MHFIANDTSYVRDWANEFGTILDALFSEDGQCHIIGQAAGTSLSSLTSKLANAAYLVAAHPETNLVVVSTQAGSKDYRAYSNEDMHVLRNWLQTNNYEEHTMLNLALQEARSSFVFITTVPGTKIPMVITNGYTNKAFLSKCVLATKLLTTEEPKLIEFYSTLLKDGVKHTTAWYLNVFREKMPEVFANLEANKAKLAERLYKEQLDAVVNTYNSSIVRIIETKLVNVNRDIKAYDEELRKLLKKANEYNKEVAYVKSDLSESNKIKELMEYIATARRTTVYNINIQPSSNTMLLYLRIITPMCLDAEDFKPMIQAARTNNTDVFGTTKITKHGTTDVLEAITNNRFTLLYVADYAIDLTSYTISVQQTAERNKLSALTDKGMPHPLCANGNELLVLHNPHIYKYECWTEARTQAVKALSTGNYIVLLEHLINATRDLNAFDTTVVNRFNSMLNGLWNSTTPLVYDNTTQEYLTLSAAAECLYNEQHPAPTPTIKVETEVIVEQEEQVTEPTPDIVPDDEDYQDDGAVVTAEPQDPFDE